MILFDQRRVGLVQFPELSEELTVQTYSEQVLVEKEKRAEASESDSTTEEASRTTLDRCESDLA
jgi:hypothetical protein